MLDLLTGSHGGDIDFCELLLIDFNLNCDTLSLARESGCCEEKKERREREVWRRCPFSKGGKEDEPGDEPLSKQYRCKIDIGLQRF